jgi:hypothetical protein
VTSPLTIPAVLRQHQELGLDVRNIFNPLSSGAKYILSQTENSSWAIKIAGSFKDLRDAMCSRDAILSSEGNFKGCEAFKLVLKNLNSLTTSAELSSLRSGEIEVTSALPSDEASTSTSINNILFSSKSTSPIRLLSNLEKTCIYAPYMATVLKNLECEERVYRIFERVFPSLESAYMLFKAAYLGAFENQDFLNHVIEGKAWLLPALKLKRLVTLNAPEVTPPGREPWEIAKLNVMKLLVAAKLRQNPVITKVLLSTAGQNLVEDTSNSFWGRGSENDGQNNLGKILVAQREALIESSS